MINVDVKNKMNLIVASPMGAMAEDDIKVFGNTIDNYINEHDRVPNLVFRVETLPHWNSFSALIHHIRLVKNHHRIIAKVAIVSDSSIMSFVQPIADHLTEAKIRQFSERALDDALNWAQMDEDSPGEFIVMNGLADDVVAIDARGLITSNSYDDQLVPLIEAKLKDHDKLKLLFVAGPYFDGYSAGAVWDDLRLGLGHITSFSKLALVTDVGWIRHGAKLFSPLMPTQVVVFDFDQLEDANSWISS